MLSARLSAARAYLEFLKGNPLNTDPPMALEKPAERSLHQNLLLTLVRHQRLLETYLAQFSGRRPEKVDAPARALAMLGLTQLRFLERIPHHAAVFETVALAKPLGCGRAQGFINAVLRQAQRSLVQTPTGENHWPDETLLPLAVATSHPDWLVERWQKQYGEAATQAICQANNQPPTLTLRVDTRKTTPHALISELAQTGMVAQPHPFWQEAVQLEHGGNLFQSPVFVQGHCYAQDVPSQIVMAWVAPHLPGRLLDACAAPGGKLTHLAALRPQAPPMLAMEFVAGRMLRLKDNLSRLGTEALVLMGDALKPPLAQESLDGVVLDVPCSATGTIRKHPVKKWQRGLEDVLANVPLQQAMLQAAAGLLRVGGLLLYITCSLEQEENQAQVATFLANNPSFSRVDWHSLPAPAALLVPAADYISAEGDFVALPNAGQMGLYAALLQKT